MHRMMAGFGWRPQDFWSATPREIQAALVPPDQGGSMPRSVLTDLMQAAPDRDDQAAENGEGEDGLARN